MNIDRLTRFDVDMDGSIEPTEDGDWVRYADVVSAACTHQSTYYDGFRARCHACYAPGERMYAEGQEKVAEALQLVVPLINRDESIRRRLSEALGVVQEEQSTVPDGYLITVKRPGKSYQWCSVDCDERPDWVVDQEWSSRTVKPLFAHPPVPVDKDQLHPVGSIHRSHLKGETPFCKNILFYSADNVGDNPDRRVTLYAKVDNEGR